MFNWIKVFAVAAVSMATVSAIAQDYPSRQPIRLVIGYPPGGPSDLLGRVISDRLSRELGQAVVVDNRGGAGGMLGAAYAASQKPDGYTLLVDGESISTRPQAIYKKMHYDPVKDFSRIARVATQRSVLVVHPSVPAKTLKEFIQYAKANPGKLDYGCSYGAASHLGASIFSQKTGISMVPINYRGGSQLTSDLVAGIVQVGFYPEATVYPYIKAGQLRPLATIASERSPMQPELPTIEEAGGPAMDLSFWTGLVAPAGTPKPIIDKLAEVSRKIAADPAFATQLVPMGASPIKGSTPEIYTSETVSEIKYWQKVVADTGIERLD
ncbi:tripartite tricarboxylate transporter substrate binding protein [Comamonas sp.]|uniref:Bug family tripartite tricarboxylate transporter substrate binding protein n=1 Tax=Comamonas sp. TaxID=34028 RepID=UPI00289CAF6E|nr:tripartite tricarboxylate transporter substrate binding protein [Comamonas sp.]